MTPPTVAEEDPERKARIERANQMEEEIKFDERVDRASQIDGLIHEDDGTIIDPNDGSIVHPE